VVAHARAAVSCVWSSLSAYHGRYLLLAAVVCVMLLFTLREVGLEPQPAEESYLAPPEATPSATDPVLPAATLPAAKHHARILGAVVVRPLTPTALERVQSPTAQPTPSAPPDDGVTTYVVQAGDDVASIAERLGLKRETLIWANKALEADPGTLYVGQELAILPVDGVYYTIQEGDTLPAVAERFGVSVEAIVDSEYNARALPGGQPETGRKLVIPGGVKPFAAQDVRLPPQPTVAAATQATGNWVWPSGGYISQGYWDLHRAIDIACRQGDVVVAADAGTVVYAEWGWAGYGNLVVIDHGNGFRSYYGHLYGFYVDVGDQVERGQPLGAIGNTGLSTGPHLHFEIREDGVLRNPIDYLP
jgi:murein DD-endopeptidase MepM/ murein hydrolase activator NlpD